MARNMNGMAIYIPNGRDDSEEPPRSPISGFGADMDTGRMTRYNADGSQETTYNDSPAQQMFQQMGQLVERGKAERQRKRNLDDAALASGMIYAKQGNGFIPPDMLQALSSQLGQEITGGNYTADGNFVLYGREVVRDPGSGRVVRSGMSPIAVATPEMQMRVLQRSGLGQGLQEQLWDYMTAPGRLTPQQVQDRGFKDPRAAQRDAEAKAAAAQSKIDEQKRQFDEKMKLERERLAARQGGGGRYDSRRAQGMKDWLDQNGKTVQDPSAPDDPTARIDNPNFDEKLYNDRLAQYNDYIWQSNLPPAEAINGGAQQAQGEANGAKQPDGEGTVVKRAKAVTPDQRIEAAKAALASRGQQTQEQPSAPQEESSAPQEPAVGGAVLSSEDERFLDETLKELEAPEEPGVSVWIPSDSPEYERRVRNGEAMRKLEKTPDEELPDWVKKLSLEEQTKYKAARTAKRGIEAITKEMGKTQGAASTSTADSYAAMLDALGPNGVLRKKLSRLLSIIDKVGEGVNSSDF